MSTIIRPATPEEFAALCGPVEVDAIDAMAAVRDGAVVAIGGTATKDGRTWVFLDVTPAARTAGLDILRALKRGLHDRNETVFCQCNARMHASAERLMRWLGFEPTEEYRIDRRAADGAQLRIWTWQNWPL